MKDSMRSETVSFCPGCGSASIETSALSGSAASCRVCSWQGKKEDLATHQFKHDFMSPDAMLHTLTNDVRRMLAAHKDGEGFVLEYGKLLLKWGFMPQADTKVLARYIGSAAAALVRSLVETRQALEKESAHEPG